jgi:hypothetical protein
LLLLSRLAGADEEECVRIVLCIGIIMMQQNNIRRTTPFRRTIDFNDARRTMWHYLDSPDRAVPSLAPNRHSSSPIVEIMKSGSEAEFRRMFRLSRTVFAALVVELSPWIKSGRSYNGDQNVTAEAKIAIALYFMAHGGNGFTLGVAAKLKSNTVLKYLHEVAALIGEKLKDKWMGYGILEQSPTYMENCRSRFHARHGFPMVGAAIDGTHVPYVPNSPAEALVCKNYNFWTSFLNIAVVNSYYCFVKLGVGWPGRFHDKTCTENSNFWFAMNARPETWLGKNGVALADSAWGVGSNMVMTPYIVNDGSTKARKKLPLHAAESRGLPPQCAQC